MADLENRFHPIIYVRGYAMTQGEINETAADPFCGFNLGSTVYRATAKKEKPANKFIFESPVIRLGTDFSYKDIFDNGFDIMDPDWEGSISNRSVIIYRYYDPASSLLGSGETPDIRKFAEGLGQLILRVRELVCKNKENNVKQDDFRCYLVAHSMGGLICRAFLQNPDFDKNNARRYVDKVFTYATPHNGIEVGGINIPKWLSVFEINTFNRERMFEYLNLNEYKETKRVDWLPKEFFPCEKFFCMVGTNRTDYEVAMGLSRTFAGHGSDGLVRIANASVWGIDNGKDSPCATAYAYRSHSGYFGIVNSEESYQNLIRFLFGDIRVDIWVDINNVQLPKAIQDEADKGKDVDALYQFEILASPRRKRWYLTRRTAEEDSVACRSHKELTDAANTKARSIYLSSVFLGKDKHLDGEHPSFAYSVTLGVRVPDYEVDQKFWFDTHYEGGYLFRDSVVIESIPKGDGSLDVTYDWQRDNLGQASQRLEPKELEKGQFELPIPFKNGTTPGINGILKLVVSRWNS